MAFNAGSIFSDFFLNIAPFQQSLQKVRASTDSTLAAMGGRAAEAGKTLGGLKDRLVQLNERLDRTAIGSRNFDILKEKIKQTEAELQRASGAQAGMNSLLTKFGAALTTGAVVAGVGKLAQMGMELEQTEVQFEVFLKSAEKAKKLLGELKTFADKSPFENMDAIQAGKSLLSAGFAADSITNKLRMLGDIAAGSSVPIQELAQVFAKMKTTDIIQAEELNQLERFGPVLSGLAGNMGLSMADLKARASAGRLSFKDLEAAMGKMTEKGGTFFGMMDRQAETAGGKWSTMVGTIEGIGQKIGLFISESMKPLLDVGNFILGMIDNLLNTMKDWYQSMSDGQKSALQMAVVLGILAVAIYALWPALTGLGVTFTGMMAAINTAMATNPILLAIMAIIGLVILMISTFDRWKSVFNPVIAQGTKLRDTLAPVFTKIISAVDSVKKAFDKMMAAFGGSALGSITKRYSALTFVVRTIGAVFALTVNSVVGGIQLMVDAVSLIIAELTVWWDMLVGIKDAAVLLFTDPLNIDSWSALGDKFASNMKSNFANVDKEAANLAKNVGEHMRSQGDIVLSVFSRPGGQKKRPGSDDDGGPPPPPPPPPPGSNGDVKALEQAQSRLLDAWKKANAETMKVTGNAELLIRTNTEKALVGLQKNLAALKLPKEFIKEFNEIQSELTRGSNEELVRTQSEAVLARAGFSEQTVETGKLRADSLKKLQDQAMIALAESDEGARSAIMQKAFDDVGVGRQWRAQILSQMKDIPILKLQVDADVERAKDRLSDFVQRVADRTRLPMADIIGFDAASVQDMNDLTDKVLASRSRIADIEREINQLRSVTAKDEADKLANAAEIEKKLRLVKMIEDGIAVASSDVVSRWAEENRLNQEILKTRRELKLLEDANDPQTSPRRQVLRENLDEGVQRQTETFRKHVGEGILEPVSQAREAFAALDADAGNLSFGQMFTAQASIVAGAVNGMIQQVGALAKQFADAFSRLTEVAQQKFARKFEIGSYFVDLFQRYEQQKMQEQIDAIRAMEDAKIDEIRRGVEMRKAMFDEEYEQRKAQLELQKTAELEALRLDYEAKLAKLHAESVDKEQAMVADDLMAQDYKDSQEALEKEHADRLAQLAAEINGNKESDKKNADAKIAELETNKNAKLDQIEKDRTAKEKANKKQNAFMKWGFESLTLEMGKAAQILQLKISGITGAAQAMVGAIASFASLGPVGLAIGAGVGAKLASMIMSATTGAISLVSGQMVMPPAELFLASGGVVRGPGGGRDDLIPANISNGEGVIDAERTAKLVASVDRALTPGGGNYSFAVNIQPGAFQGVGDMDEAKIDMLSQAIAVRTRAAFESNYRSMGI